MDKQKNTRERIFDHIRTQPTTVDALAKKLEITPAAVRSQMNRLEKEGLVIRGELVRGGAGQPAIIYQAAQHAEDAFSTAYKPLLVNLLDTLPESLSSKELNKIMRDTGKKIALNHPSFGKTIRERVGNTVAVLNDLGALIEVDEVDCDIRLISHACPLAAAVKCRPEVCTAVRAFIAEATACSVKEKCQRDQSPRPAPPS